MFDNKLIKKFWWVLNVVDKFISLNFKFRSKI